MLNNPEARSAVSRLIEPPARGLLRIGLTPDAITYGGAIGTSAAALWFFPRGQFVAGVLVMALFIFSDLLDGTMARLSGRAGPWGNYLDSTLDRVADGAVFGGVLIYFAMRGEAWPTAAAWICLVGAFTVSYAKARAESVGATANVGLAERAERLIVILVAAFVQGLWPSGWVLSAATGVLALLTLVTIMQRFAVVRRQLIRRAPDAPAPSAGEAGGPSTLRQAQGGAGSGTDLGPRTDSEPKTDPGFRAGPSAGSGTDSAPGTDAAPGSDSGPGAEDFGTAPGSEYAPTPDVDPGEPR